MARVSVQLTNFTAGELSPRLDGRNDLSKYPSGCKTLENFIVYPHGSAARRSGSQFISEVKTSSKKTRLIPFEFSTTQTYILEFGDQYIRVYKDKGQVQSGGSAVEISTPYLEAELFDLKFAQSADVLYICHPNHEVEKLSRTSHTSWTLADVDFTKGPMQDANTTTTTLNPGATAVGTGVSLAASATTGMVNRAEPLPRGPNLIPGTSREMAYEEDADQNFMGGLIEGPMAFYNRNIRNILGGGNTA